jgi:hypothetical protein
MRVCVSLHTCACAAVVNIKALVSA